MSRFSDAEIRRTLRLDAGQFEQSPFIDLYATAETIYGVYAGRFYAETIGNDPVQGYWNLRRKAGLYDVPERPIEIEGPDALVLLEKAFARPIATLKVGRARYAIACLPDGGILMDGIVMRLDEGRFWYVQADGEFDTWLTAHALGLDVRISDPQSRVLQIQGPKSMAVMRVVTGGELTADLPYFGLGIFEFGGQSLLVSRTGWTGELGYEIYTQGAATDCAALWQHLLRHGEAEGLVVSTAGSMAIRRIEAGILNNRTDMDQSMNPFQAGLGPFIDLDKLDFTGREALQNADQGLLLFGLTCPDATPERGHPVLDGDNPVGHITARAWSPYLRCGIGIVRFAEAGDWPGRRLSLKSRDGSLHEATITCLPFYDPEKRLPRGLDSHIPEIVE